MLKITIIALCNKMPNWVIEGTEEYQKRFADIQLRLVDIPLIKRGKSSDIARILEKEALLMRDAIPSSARVIALDRTGKTFASEELATHLEVIQQQDSHLCFLIGGPEGITDNVLKICHERWSLSKLTLPHTLARIMLLETLYRSWSIIQNHPYHK